jgi:beta-glucosidase/6-phospho-beta-glucosidase/beta-galactosidase
MVRARNMAVMLTLFHHSMPKWGAAYGGWTHPQSVEHFHDFSEAVVGALGDLVDYWVPFNEPTVFVGLTYCAGAWPPGFPEPGPLTSGICMMAPVIGNYSRAMAHIALGHRAAARAIRAKYTAPIGCAPARGAAAAAQSCAQPCPCPRSRSRLTPCAPRPACAARRTTSRTCRPRAPLTCCPRC